MTTASATTNETGYMTSVSFKVGTGGHGDTSEIYSKHYILKNSMVRVFDYRIKTGQLDHKGKPKYKAHYKKVIRAKVLGDVLNINYIAHEELSKLPFTNSKSPVDCNDLIDGKGVKIGLSISIGHYEARIIQGKCQLMSKGKPVRLFKTGVSDDK